MQKNETGKESRISLLRTDSAETSMKMNRGTALLVLTVGALASVGTLGGTMAYLTDRGSVTNTFTVGQVTVDLSEPDYPGNDAEQVRNLVPNQEVHFGSPSFVH